MSTSASTGAVTGPVTLKSLLRARFVVVWFVLIAATLISWFLGTDQGFDSTGVVTTVVLVVAFVKVRLVGLDFMELRNAPLPLRLVFEVYCVALVAVLLGLYWIS